ncbi:MAG: T9SS type A sorting domain-containing protein [Saprospiraceae bacterium]|nr:T9SS type A sorting domain-containing protein [Saprospiraceae bacterium]
MLKYLLCCLLPALAGALNAQNYFTDISENAIPAARNSVRHIAPKQYRTVRLSLEQLQPILSAAPDRFKPAGGAEQEAIVLSLPMPDGTWERFLVAEASVMAPALQAKYPEIRCYTGTGIDDPTASLKCDLTPQGFHAMIRSTRHAPIFIDPYRQGDREHCIVYRKQDLDAKEPFACSLDEEIAQQDKAQNPAPDAVGDCTFRRYRLALACTGEYANFHGGTKPLILAAMNTTMNRVNGIYERDLSVTMQLIANNDTLIFLDPVTDGYSNGNGSSMLTQNQSKCNTIIGSANYDIGHVFSTGGGGIAGLGVVCNNSTKARGVTGRGAPIGDPFDVDYVAHEMGHQFDADHTQNNACGRNPATAMEPGSASTIMGYAGICSPNIQANSDAYFHAINLQEIGNFITTGPGNVCPVKTTTGNTAPVVNAGADYIIPRSTPFALTAIGFDADSDPITYCWEQMNNEIATMPPLATNAGGPMFRSFDPGTSPTRYFPRLQDLAANANTTWERLPGVARNMNFRVTVRDNKPTGGCTGEDNMVVTVAGNAGPFVVTDPNTATTWYVGEFKTVTWEVAATDAAPVNCSEVRLLLSTDGGLTYPFVLANSVPNTGSALVEVPNQLSTTCRVMAQSVGNVFFDISDENFAIAVPLVPTFFLSTSVNSSEQRCTGQTLLVDVGLIASGGFNGPINLSVDGAPANATVTISENPAMPGVAVTIEFANLDQPGVYPLTITAKSDTITRTAAFELTVIENQPAVANLVSPADGTSGIPLKQTLSWDAVPDALSYQVQVAVGAPVFAPGNTVFDQTTNATSVTVSGLQAGTVYYWRVEATNACGTSGFSDFFAFQTGQPECGFTFAANDLPIAIPDTSAALVTSSLNISDSHVIADVNVGLKINHSWVGDLAARLVAPDGTTALLFEHPGFPALSSGCNGENLDLEFDDAAVLTATDLENTCDNQPAIAGAFQPIQLLDRFHDIPVNGAWKMEVADIFPEDGGSIVEWNLTFCFYQEVPPAEILVNTPLTLASGSTKALSIANLVLNISSGNPADGVFTLLTVPQYGALILNGSPLVVGDLFTQADILSGDLVYINSGDTATADAFVFDATDVGTNGWIHGATFHIVVVQNDLAVTAEVTQPLLCRDGATAQITVQVAGGTPPLVFSLNGGTGQFLNVFGNLSAGIYTVVVTDDYGFTAEANVVVDNPPALNLSATATNDDISVQANSGLPPFEYSLDGQSFQSEPLFEDLPNGDYTVTLRDANGCTGTATVTVFVGPLTAQLITVGNVTCPGGADGLLVVGAIGGVAPYQFSLDGVTFQPTSVFVGLSTGTYTVTVLDDSGNTAVVQTATISEPPMMVVNAVVNLNTISVTASGGTGALAFSLDGQTFQADGTFGGLANGDYTVTVRDANGCTATTTSTVAVPPLVLAGLGINGEILCAGQTVSVLVSVAGGVPPYAFSLDGGAYQPDSLFENVGGGVHEILVRDAAGTEVSSQSFVFVEPDPINAAALVAARTATVAATGGTSPYQYALNGSTPQDSNEFENLPNGSYTVTVTDANGCTETVEFEVSYVDLSGNIAVTNPACAGGSDGAILLEVFGGTPPFECSVNGGPCNLSDLSAGTYTVVITDALGDTIQIEAVLTDPPALIISADAADNDITATATGGTGTLEFSLDGATYQPAPVFADLPNGVYTVFVRDENGCVAESDTVLVDYVGTVSPEQAWGMTVRPNPGTGYYLLVLNQAPAGVLRTDVFDAGGRLVFQQKYEPTQPQYSAPLDLTGFPAGTYTLRLVSGNQVGAVRVIKQ